MPLFFFTKLTKNLNQNYRKKNLNCEMVYNIIIMYRGVSQVSPPIFSKILTIVASCNIEKTKGNYQVSPPPPIFKKSNYFGGLTWETPLWKYVYLRKAVNKI